MSPSRLFASILVASLSGVAACGGDTPAPEAASPAAAAGAEHAHTAPHGGTLIELGEHFGFVEFVHDADAGTLTAYVLDGGAEAAVRITQPAISVVVELPATLANQTLQLAGKANVLTGETLGDTSQFVVAHDALKDAPTFSGRVIEVSVKGQAFRDQGFTTRR